MKKWIIVLIVFGLLACAGQQTYPQQIADQGGTTMQINQASYLQALTYYNQVRDAFVMQVETFPEIAKQDEAVKKWVKNVYDVLNESGKTLDQWKMANAMMDNAGSIAASNNWALLRAKLISFGLTLILEK